MKKTFVKNILLGLVEKTMTTYVQSTLLIVYYSLANLTYGLHNVFVVVNFISSDWEAKHVTIRLFK